MAAAASRLFAGSQARVARDWRDARRRRPVRPTRRAVPRATAAADDASCSLSADASSFRFEGTRRLYGDARFDALTNAHVVVLGLVPPGPGGNPTPGLRLLLDIVVVVPVVQKSVSCLLSKFTN